MEKEKEEEVNCGCNCDSCSSCGEVNEENIDDGILNFTDEEGNDTKFEILDVITMDEKEYLVVLPLDMEEDSDDAGVLILEIKEEDGEEVYDTVVDEKLAEKVFQKFQEQNDEEDEEEDEDDK